MAKKYTHMHSDEQAADNEIHLRFGPVGAPRLGPPWPTGGHSLGPSRAYEGPVGPIMGIGRPKLGHIMAHGGPKLRPIMAHGGPIWLGPIMAHSLGPS